MAIKCSDNRHQALIYFTYNANLMGSPYFPSTIQQNAPAAPKCSPVFDTMGFFDPSSGSGIKGIRAKINGKPQQTTR